jgi:ethanolamine utilization protein EutP
MAIGPVGAGKSTLLQRLGLTRGPVRKTGTVEFCGEAVDTPGEAFEIPTFFHMLIMSSSKASLVLLLADPTRKKRFPARFALSMRAPTVGIVSKIDISSTEEIGRAERTLFQCGVKKVFKLSSLTGEGIDELRDFLDRGGTGSARVPFRE